MKVKCRSRNEQRQQLSASAVSASDSEEKKKERKRQLACVRGDQQQLAVTAQSMRVVPVQGMASGEKSLQLPPAAHSQELPRERGSGLGR